MGTRQKALTPFLKMTCYYCVINNLTKKKKKIDYIQLKPSDSPSPGSFFLLPCS